MKGATLWPLLRHADTRPSDTRVFPLPPRNPAMRILGVAMDHTMSMKPAGHSSAHFLQPVQLCRLKV